MTRNPLLPIAVAFAAGVWSARYFFLSASQQVFWLAVIFLLAVVLLRMQQNFYSLIASLMGFFLCGTFLAAAEHSVLPPRHIESLVNSGLIRPDLPLEIVGWARTPSVTRPGGEYFDFVVTEVNQAGSAMPAEGAVRLYYYLSRRNPSPLSVSYGRRYLIEVQTLRRPRNFMTPGFYDSAARMKREGVWFTASIRNAADVQVLPGRAGSGWQAVLYALRGRLLHNLDRLHPPARDQAGHGAILKAMLLGDNNWLRPDTAAAFQESGTYHLLVVSGLHVGALAFGLFWIFSWLRIPHWLQTPAVLTCLFAFTFMSTAQIPAMRATLMISLYLAARLIYRERALVNSMCAAALILLVLQPSDLFDLGFQVSFLSVLIIGAIAVPIVEWTVVPYRRALNGIAEKARDIHLQPKQAQFRQDVRILLDYVCDPSRLVRRRWRILRELLVRSASGLLLGVEAALAVIFIQAGLSLSMAIYFNRVVWSGIAANLIVLPLTALVVPLGFVVLLLSLLWFPAALAGAKILDIAVWLLHGVAEWSAHLPGLDRRVPAPPLSISLVFAALLLVIAVLANRRSKWVWPFAAGLIPIGLVLTFAPYRAQLPHGVLEVTALDVGQGDSLFIAFPRGRTMLVDGGGALPIGGLPPRLDVGERIVSPYLWSRNLKSVDFIVLTHAHADHLGGLSSVLRDFRVGELWLGAGPSNAGLQELMRLAASRGVPTIRKKSGDRMDIDGVETLVLSPPADWNPRRVSNNDSLVLRLGYGARHFLLPGDVEGRMEKRLAEQDLPIASDVLKVAHHGSKTSTTSPFLSRVAPRFGIVSVGPFGRFGLPHPEVLQVLADGGVVTYRTDKDGSVTVSTDGNSIGFVRFRDAIHSWPPFRIAPYPFADLLSR